MIRVVHPGSGSCFFYPSSRIQGSKKAPDPGPNTGSHTVCPGSSLEILTDTGTLLQTVKPSSAHFFLLCSLHQKGRKNLKTAISTYNL
jgi:hypothetical protein